MTAGPEERLLFYCSACGEREFGQVIEPEIRA
jgi:hypothetical protein